MAQYPQSLKNRDELNLRLGIKSSLPHLRSVVASIYLLYLANDRKATVTYADELQDNGITKLNLQTNLASSLKEKFGMEFVPLVQNSPLFSSQLESLQVGLELFFHLAKVNFTRGGLSERTGSSRYQKELRFTTNLCQLDLYLDSHSIEDVKKFLYAWLQDTPFPSKIERGALLMLSYFSEDVLCKMRTSPDEKELVFQREGIYSSLLSNEPVISDDAKEQVGPFRILKSYVSAGLHPFLQEKNHQFVLNGDNDQFKTYATIVSNTLDVYPPKRNPGVDIPNSNSLRLVTSTPTTYSHYLTALRTKPFMLLAGISGTGKSRIVRKLAQSCVTEELQRQYDSKSIENGFDRWQLHKPANFELVQVKPNWHNSLEVVGYKSNIGGAHYEFTSFVRFVARAWQHQDIPFFLCLDEMNLAPVEQYFAEFLSAIESRSMENGLYETDPIIKPFCEFNATDSKGNVTDNLADRMIAELLGRLDSQAKSDLAERFRTKGLTLPKNLFVLGTVNMDETTFSFSRKVLDRAMSIVMNEVKYDQFFTGDSEDDMDEMSAETMQLLIDREIRGVQAEQNDSDTVENYLSAINGILDNTPFKLGYRAANEALLYVSATHLMSDKKTEDALDEFTMMKILSRIEGDKRSVDTILTDLQEVITEAYPKSNKKLKDMADTLKNKQFVSYWN